MTIKYNRTGTDRKSLVDAIANITGAEAKYLGAPSFAYQVDYFTIDRNGTITFDDRADSEEIESLIERLASMGFEAEPVERETSTGAEPPAAHDGLTIQMPLLLVLGPDEPQPQEETPESVLVVVGVLFPGGDALLVPCHVAESGDQVRVCLDLLSGGLAAEPGEGDRVGLHLDRQEVNAQGLADQPPLGGDEAVAKSGHKSLCTLWLELACYYLRLE